jgi:hypothetical protein
MAATYSLDVPSGGSTWRCFAASPRVAFTTVFVQSIVHFVLPPAWGILYTSFSSSSDSEMATDSSNVTTDDPILERKHWFWVRWLGATVFAAYWTALVLSKMGVNVGAVWVKGQMLEAQKQVLLQICKTSTPCMHKLHVKFSTCYELRPKPVPGKACAPITQ